MSFGHCCHFPAGVGGEDFEGLSKPEDLPIDFILAFGLKVKEQTKLIFFQNSYIFFLWHKVIWPFKAE